MARLILLLFACTSVLAVGCAMCDDPYDESYSAYGGLLPEGDDLSQRLSHGFGNLSDVTVPERASGTPELAPETEDESNEESQPEDTEEEQGRITQFAP